MAFAMLHFKIKFASLVEALVDNPLGLGNNLFLADFLKDCRTFR